MTLNAFCYIGKGGKKAHMALVFPPGKCYLQVAIQTQWSKQVYISQNNKEGANTCSISQQPAWLQLGGLLSLGIVLGNILKTQKTFRRDRISLFVIVKYCLQWS